jgi:hypothetical protein
MLLYWAWRLPDGSLTVKSTRYCQPLNPRQLYEWNKDRDRRTRAKVEFDPIVRAASLAEFKQLIGSLDRFTPRRPFKGRGFRRMQDWVGFIAFVASITLFLGFVAACAAGFGLVTTVAYSVATVVVVLFWRRGKRE